MARRATKAGLIGAASAAGLGAAVGAGRFALGRIRSRRDAEADGTLGQLRGRELTVLASDGVPLHVEIDGPETAPLTVVFCHGYALNQDAWHFQRRDLAPDRGLRMVFWDQRSHGRSGRSDAAHTTIDQCGEDLYAVLRATVRPGDPVVLAGHSMGGMTIMALADRHPGLFAEQVAGIVFVNTSPGELGDVTFGLPKVLGGAFRVAAPGVVRMLGKRANIVDKGRDLGSDVACWVTRRMGFGDKEASPAVVGFVEQMIRETPIDVVAEFYPALMAHDKYGALAVLGEVGVPVVVVTGDADRLTPASHGRVIAEAIPDAELIELGNAGHVAMLEHPELVTSVLRRLLRAVRDEEPEEQTA